MEINLLNRISPLMAVNPAPKPHENGDVARPVVAAVRALNKSELLGSDRELQFSRDSSTRTFIIKLVDRTTGEVLEQIPSEKVLQIMADLNQSNNKDGSNL